MRTHLRIFLPIAWSMKILFPMTTNQLLVVERPDKQNRRMCSIKKLNKNEAKSETRGEN